MIFLGDLACPDERADQFLSDVNSLDIFKDEIVILNLEGNIVENEVDRNQHSLYNSSKIASAFSKSRKVIVSLANNHTYDYPDKITRTKIILDENGIGCFGLKNGDGSFSPYEFSDNGISYALFGHCWKLYSKTNPNRKNNLEIVDTDYELFLETVSEYISFHAKTKVYCFMHWNYDLEQLPFPMHRKLSKALIDSGVSGVIGGHSHCPQGVELYKNCPIAYGLGNFYLPSGVFFDGELSYPDYCKQSYGVRITDNQFDVIWFSTDTDDKTVKITESGVTSIDEDERIANLSEYSKYDEDEYVDYFKKHRTKRLLVPVFSRYSGRSYYYREKLAVLRIQLLKRLFRK